MAAAVEVGEVLGVTAALIEYGQLSQIAELRGQWDDHAAMWERSRGPLGPFMNGLPMDAVIAQAHGGREQAGRLSEQWFDELPRHPAVGRLTSVLFAGRLAPVLSPATAESAYTQLAPHRDVWMFAGPEVMWGSMALALARYALCMGRVDDAIGHFETASRIARARRRGAGARHDRIGARVRARATGRSRRR